jgi:uncharacterized protein YegJ (DUF2314 family)
MWKRIKSIFERPTKEPLFMGVRGDDVEMREAYSKAAETIDEFVAHIRSGGDRTCAAKLRLKDPALSEKLGEDRFVYMWLADAQHLDDGAFVGTFFQVPSELSEWHQVGKQLQFERKDIFDWFVNDEGVMHGGFTMRVQRSRLPERERAAFDAYTGVTEWAKAVR